MSTIWALGGNIRTNEMKKEMQNTGQEKVENGNRFRFRKKMLKKIVVNLYIPVF